MVLRAVSNPVVTQSLQEYSEHAEVHYCHVKMFWQFISSRITIFSSSWFFMNQRQHNTSQLTFLSLHSLCSEPTRFSKRPCGSSAHRASPRRSSSWSPCTSWICTVPCCCLSSPAPAAADCRVGARLMEHRCRDAAFVRVNHGPMLNASVSPVA